MPSAKPGRNQLAVGLIIAVGLAVVGGLVWGFGRQLSLAQQMRAEEMRLEQIVATEEARHKVLITRLEYVKSDEYVEHWAREEAGMSKPGEVIVIPLGDAGDTAVGGAPPAEPQPEQIPRSASRPFWVELWELIFGPADG